MNDVLDRAYHVSGALLRICVCLWGVVAKTDTPFCSPRLGALLRPTGIAYRWLVENQHMRPGDEIFVTAKHDYGTAGVGWADKEGTWWLSAISERGPGTGLRGYEPGIEGLGSEKTVQGGRLPPGAVAAEVIDDHGNRLLAAAANGAWVIVLDQGIDGEVCPVRFLDADGQTVRVPVPDAWPRKPIEDAADVCPVCGELAWDEVIPLDGSWGMEGLDDGDLEPSPIAVCRQCGHQESLGGFYAPLPAESDEPTEESIRLGREMLERHRSELRAGLQGIDFPIYQFKGEPALLGQWGSRGEGLTDVTVAAEREGRLELETELRDRDFGVSEASLAREALSVMADSEPWPRLSPAALGLWMNRERRRERGFAAGATVDTRKLEIDGKEETWTVAEAGDAWVAIRRHGPVTLTIRAKGVSSESVSLERVANPAQLQMPELPPELQ